MLSGYAGSIAWVDLTGGSVRVDELGEGIARKYLGGKGLGAYLLYRSLNPHIHPYDPENKLIFITGPLTGTPFPAVSFSGRLEVRGNNQISHDGDILGFLFGRILRPAYEICWI
jgi:aldehyde:ferredoxin oxidoreductase